MEILPTIAYEKPLHPQWLPNIHAGFRAALGLGGGGAVPTGGGIIGKAGAVIHWRGEQGWTAGVGTDLLRGTDSRFRGYAAQAWVAMPLEPKREGWQLSAPGVVTRYEWIPAIQQELQAARKAGAAAGSKGGAVSTIGIKLNRWFGDSFYVSGQAHSAFAGGAGAYSIGLVGAGVATADRDRRWQVGAEALIGAAGGGGIASGGGAIVQTLAWVGWKPGRGGAAVERPANSAAVLAAAGDGAAGETRSWNPLASGQWRVGVGAMRSLSGTLRSPVIELSWRRAFGLNGV
jgi:hypothetical protein